MATIALTVELTSVTCGECGGTYAIAERYRKQKFEAKGFWNCPYCKTSWGYADGENDALRRRLAEAEARMLRERAAKDQERAAKDQAIADRIAAAKKLERKTAASKRLQKKIAKGTCPCCEQEFPNLERHIAEKHPNYKKKHAASEEQPCQPPKT